ncbi:hypothetical protein [Microcoleus sp. herbarium14]|uniref:hypothetical protein n=1 Tax=Microcoleus sp. herbarium14 TaxID=3055439 RepID=UPI002FD5A3CA
MQLATQLAPEAAIVAILAVSCSSTQNPEPQADLFAPTYSCGDLFDRESSNTLLSRNKYHIKYAETRFVKISTSEKL